MGKKLDSKAYDARFGDYCGSDRYEVWHPDHKKTLRVAAPDEYAAMKAAGDFWNEDWLKIHFYALCRVTKI